MSLVLPVTNAVATGQTVFELLREGHTYAAGTDVVALVAGVGPAARQRADSGTPPNQAIARHPTQNGLERKILVRKTQPGWTDPQAEAPKVLLHLHWKWDARFPAKKLKMIVIRLSLDGLSFELRSKAALRPKQKRDHI